MTSSTHTRYGPGYQSRCLPTPVPHDPHKTPALGYSHPCNFTRTRPCSSQETLACRSRHDGALRAVHQRFQQRLWPPCPVCPVPAKWLSSVILNPCVPVPPAGCSREDRSPPPPSGSGSPADAPSAQLAVPAISPANGLFRAPLLVVRRHPSASGQSSARGHLETSGSYTSYCVRW